VILGIVIGSVRGRSEVRWWSWIEGEEQGLVTSPKPATYYVSIAFLHNSSRGAFSHLCIRLAFFGAKFASTTADIVLLVAYIPRMQSSAGGMHITRCQTTESSIESASPRVMPRRRCIYIFPTDPKSLHILQ
jgi:hypothetical protein